MRYNNYRAITPSDTVAIESGADGDPLTDAIYVGGAGAVVAVLADGRTVTFAAVPVGTILPIRALRVNASSTTATNLVALYTQ